MAGFTRGAVLRGASNVFLTDTMLRGKDESHRGIQRHIVPCRDTVTSCRATTNRTPVTLIPESQRSVAPEMSPHRILVPAATPAHLPPRARAQFAARSAAAPLSMLRPQCQSARQFQPVAHVPFRCF